MILTAMLPVAFLAGLLGSGHCLGMCGPVVVLLETDTASGGTPGWLRRLTYNAGRASFYILLGAVAGGLGFVITRSLGLDIGLRVFRWLAAGLVIALGLSLAFNLNLLRGLESGGARLWQHIQPLAKRVLPIRSPTQAYAAGLLWGALPCGLVYSAVALAASTGRADGGALLMAAFWLGTLPSMLAAGRSARTLAQWSRNRRLRGVAGALIAGTGVLALAMPMIMPLFTAAHH